MHSVLGVWRRFELIRILKAGATSLLNGRCRFGGGCVQRAKSECQARADKLYGKDGIDTAAYGDSDIGVYVSLKSGLGFNGDASGDELSSIETFPARMTTTCSSVTTRTIHSTAWEAMTFYGQSAWEGRQ